MNFHVCRRCKARSDAFGCYETCTVNGPLHDWEDPDVLWLEEPLTAEERAAFLNADSTP